MIPDEITVTVTTDSDGSLWAEVEEFPGCFASGDNEQELTEALEEAIGVYLSVPGKEVMVRIGRPSHVEVHDHDSPHMKRELQVC